MMDQTSRGAGGFRSHETPRPRWFLRTLRGKEGLPEGKVSRGGGRLGNAWFSHNTFCTVHAVVLYGPLEAAMALIFKRLQSRLFFGNSFDVEIAPNAVGCFVKYWWCQILQTACNGRMFASWLLRGYCGNVLLYWNKEAQRRPLFWCKNKRKWDD